MQQSGKMVWSVCAGVALIAALAWWQADDAPLRIAPVQAAQAATPALRLQGTFDVVGEAHPIALDAAMARAAMRDGTLRVTLPDGTTYPVKLQRQETDAFGQWSVIGHVDTPVGPQASVLTFGGEAVFGTLPMPNGRLLRVVTNHGRVLASLDGGLMPPGKPFASDIAPRPKQDLAQLRAQRLAARGVPSRNAISVAAAQKERVAVPASTPVSLAMPPVANAGGLPPITITVMAAYADDLIALRGSEAAVMSELSNLVAAANQAHIDSNSRVRFSLVRRQKLTVSTMMDNFDVLYQMTADVVGGMELELLRDQYSADLVTFVRPSNPGYSDCGIAWVGGSGNRGTETENLFGFSVVNTEPCGAHVMAHELGHNLGSAHDRETGWVDGEYPHGSHPYAFGYRRLTAPKFATIMAYTDANEPWIGRFSDPNSTLCGARCGIADLSDNVRAFDQMAQTVSEFRSAPGKLTVSDGEGWEPDPGTGDAYVSMPVRLNGYAMNAPVPISVQIIGGTATPNVDYAASGPFLDSYAIPQGYRSEVLFRLPILPDTLVEGDETVILKVTTSSGWPILDDTAVLTIRDDDPRLHLRGRFDERARDILVGSCATYGTAYGLNGPREESVDFQSTSSCGFDLPVAPGANVELRQRALSNPYRFLPTIFNDVRSDIYKVIPAPQGVEVFGSMQPAPGETFAPNQFFQVQTVETYQGKTLNEEDSTGTGYWFRRVIYPGATLEVNAQLNAQYQPWYGVLTNLLSDTTVTPTLRSGGTLIVRGGQPWAEGRAGRTYRVPVQIAYVPKSGQEPQIGTINVAWRTVDGTAKAGADYVGASGNVSLTAAEPSKIVYVETLGNDIAQLPRAFDVAITAPAAYNITNASTRITIMDDDRRLGGPGQKQ